MLIVSSICLLGIIGCNSATKPDISPEPTAWKKPVDVGYISDIVDGYLEEFQFTIEKVESSPNAKSVTQITSNSNSDVSIKDPAHHPTNSDIIYTELQVLDDDELVQSQSSVLWVQSPTRKARVRLTDGSFNNGEAVYNNSGESIVFSSARTNSNEGLWKIKSNGLGGILKLTDFPSSELRHPTVGINDQIAFHAIDPNYQADNEENQPFIWLMSSDGSIPTQLRYGQNPSISPDGSTIVFSRLDLRTNKNQIFTMDLNGGRIRQLTYNMEYDIKDPEWHPNGTHLIYASNEGNNFDADSVGANDYNDYNIWIMSADGSMQTQLTTNESHDDQPIFSPDGKYVYFRSNRGGFWNIWRFEPVF